MEGKEMQVQFLKARPDSPVAIYPNRYIGLARNQAAIEMISLCYNIRCYETTLCLKVHPRAA